MKHLIQIQLITSLLVLIAFGCAQENNNPNPINSVSNCDSSCSYDSICLDYHLYDTIEQNELLGQWELEAFIDTVDCSIELKPSDLTGNVIIEFHNNDSISGHTLSNTYSGKYLTEINKILFPKITSTDVLDLEWGDKFSKALKYTEYFTIANNMLIIHSKNTILVFNKIGIKL